MTFGQKIRELREVYGLTQSQIAERVFLSSSYVAQVERDEREINLKNAQRFADLFSMTLSDLLEDVEADRG